LIRLQQFRSADCDLVAIDLALIQATLLWSRLRIGLMENLVLASLKKAESKLASRDLELMPISAEEFPIDNRLGNSCLAIATYILFLCELAGS
jgi:hypothetical protein